MDVSCARAAWGSPASKFGAVFRKPKAYHRCCAHLKRAGGDQRGDVGRQRQQPPLRILDRHKVAQRQALAGAQVEAGLRPLPRARLFRHGALVGSIRHNLGSMHGTCRKNEAGMLQARGWSENSGNSGNHYGTFEGAPGLRAWPALAGASLPAGMTCSAGSRGPCVCGRCCSAWRCCCCGGGPDTPGAASGEGGANRLAALWPEELAASLPSCRGGRAGERRFFCAAEAAGPGEAAPRFCAAEWAGLGDLARLREALLLRLVTSRSAERAALQSRRNHVEAPEREIGSEPRTSSVGKLSRSKCWSSPFAIDGAAACVRATAAPLPGVPGQSATSPRALIGCRGNNVCSSLRCNNQLCPSSAALRNARGRTHMQHNAPFTPARLCSSNHIARWSQIPFVLCSPAAVRRSPLLENRCLGVC